MNQLNMDQLLLNEDYEQLLRNAIKINQMKISYF